MLDSTRQRLFAPSLSDPLSRAQSASVSTAKGRPDAGGQTPTRPAARRGLSWTLACLAVAWAALGCDSGDKPPPAPGGGGSPGPGQGSVGGSQEPDGSTTDASSPEAGTDPAPCAALDVLFVIDNDASMLEEQANLRTHLAEFLGGLDRLSPNYRIGVVATAFDQPGAAGFISAGLEGVLLQTAEMPLPWLERGDPELIDILATLTSIGPFGINLRQPLRVARSALTDRSGVAEPNGTFMREDALLALVVLSNNDDRSTRDGTPDGPALPIGELIASFEALKPAPATWRAALIAGDLMPECTSTLGAASFAERLLGFADAAPGRAQLISLCPGDLAGPLAEAVDWLGTACQSEPTD